MRDGHGQPAVTATDLEDACVGEVGHAFERREMRSLGIEDARPIHSGVVGVGGDALAKLLVRTLHLRVVAVDMLACEAKQLVVVGSFKSVAARTVNGSHGYLLL